MKSHPFNLRLSYQQKRQLQKWMAQGWILAFLICLSPLAAAKPDAMTIEREYQILAPYQSQITQRLNSVSTLIEQIVKQLKQQSLPIDLALVPMLESSYNPKAISHANAAGLWQLIPATATRFGLNVTKVQDQRFDTQASTQAALAYFTFLYTKFEQDMALTLAAYNAGEGRVAKAIKAAGSNDFNALTLPKETQQYVSRFYALQQLVDVQRFQTETFQPLQLFSSSPQVAKLPLINLDRLPPLITLN